MRSEEITKFLRENVEPLKSTVHGDRYRASVRLNDGFQLPCVVFQSRDRWVDLALRRFAQLREKADEYRRVVEAFIADTPSVAQHTIQEVAASPFAWPASLLRAIEGETTMGWTSFVVEMADGTMYSYGTALQTEFFDLPKGYSYTDVARIHSGKVYSPTEGLQNFSEELRTKVNTFREKLFFNCYIAGL
jgi:hypothetical protein